MRWTIFDLANRQEANDLLLAQKQKLLGYAAILVAIEAVFLVAGVLAVIA